MASMNDLVVQSAFIPFAVAVVAAGMLRLFAGSTHGPAMAGASLTLAFLTGYILIFGAPAFWPPSATQKIFFIAIIGGIFGLSLDLSREARQITMLAAALAPTAAILWLGWPRIVALDGLDILTLALTALAGGGILTELYSRHAQPSESEVKLLIAAGTLALVALLGTSASYAQLAGILAAGAAGFLFWLWPVTRCRFAASAVFGGGLVFIALVAAIGVFTDAPKPALGLLLPIFFADRALGRFDTGIRKLNQALKPALLAVIALIPAIAAVGLAHLLGGSGY
jgi:hypothetical protein